MDSDQSSPGPVAGQVPESADRMVEDSHVKRILEEARAITRATGAAIALFRGTEMVCCASSGSQAPDLETRLDPNSGLSGHCVQTRQCQQCSDTETDPRVDLKASRSLGVRSIAVLPLLESGKLVGIFELFWPQPNAFSPQDLERLKTLADGVLESAPSKLRTDENSPLKDGAANPVQAELMAREAFIAGTQQDARTRRRSNRTTIQLAVVVAVALLLGWVLGRAGWNMAVNRAETQYPTTLENATPAAPDTPSAPANADKQETKLPEKAAPVDGKTDQLPAEVTQTSDLGAGPAQNSETTSSYLLRRVEPKYPLEARQKHIQGRVVMKVLVGTDGLIRDLVVTSGDPSLIQAATNAVRQWRFKPHRLQGQPAEFETRITVNFSLT